MASINVGYFACIESGGKYIGAVMVTDSSGIPVEFKYAEPIKPTRIQSILYGGSLERYIKMDVIRAKLVKSLERKPVVLFIDTSDLSLLGQCEGTPVVAAQRAHIPPLAGTRSKRIKENELLVQVQEGGDPLRLVFAPRLDSESQDRIGALALDLAATMDMTEPLGRVERALEALLKEGSQ